MLKADRYLEALAAAEEAIRIDGQRFTAYYYAAFALFGRDLIERRRSGMRSPLSSVLRPPRSRMSNA
jgi:hypothetical protein